MKKIVNQLLKNENKKLAKLKQLGIKYNYRGYHDIVKDFKKIKSKK